MHAVCFMHLHHSQHVRAPLETVWQHAADFGAVAAWTPELAASALTKEPAGPGVERVCTLARPWLGQEKVRERLLMLARPVLQYEVTHPFAMFAHADNTWTLTPDGDGTRVQINARLRTRWGLLGKELAWLVRPRISYTVRRALRSFAAHVEAA